MTRGTGPTSESPEHKARDFGGRVALEIPSFSTLLRAASYRAYHALSVIARNFQFYRPYNTGLLRRLAEFLSNNGTLIHDKGHWTNI
jgi:hypothetical protein